MKVFAVFLISLLFFTNSFGQSKKEKLHEDVISSLPVSGDKIIFEKVYNVDSSLSKDMIYDRLRQWNLSALTDYKRAVKIDDKVTGVLVSQLTSPVYKKVAIVAYSGYMTFTLSVAAKDGKYKCQLSDFVFTQKQGYTEDKFVAEDVLNPDASKKMSKNTISAFGDIPKICDLVSNSIFQNVSQTKSITEF